MYQVIQIMLIVGSRTLPASGAGEKEAACPEGRPPRPTDPVSVSDHAADRRAR